RRDSIDHHVLISLCLLSGRQEKRLDILGYSTLEHHRIARDVSLVDNYNDDPRFPRFAEEIQNVTVSVGRDALLACIVDNLQTYKTVFTNESLRRNVFSGGLGTGRYSNDIVDPPKCDYPEPTDLSIVQRPSLVKTQESDRGWYMCQVNTDPMRYRQGYVQVVVPPSIIDKDTSTDMVVREATNVTLTCKAKGYPAPYVMWRRADGKSINYDGKIVNVIDGEVLHIVKISRLHMGKYLCIASNGVPPSVSKSVTLNVHFPPMLSIPNQLEAAYIGQDVTLECHIEAFPTAINYWTTENGDMIVSGDKYVTVFSDNDYTKYMLLKIRNVSPKDFGSYKCVAQNSLGATDGVIKLDEIPAPSTTSTTQSPYYVTSLMKKNGRNGNKKLRQRPNDYEIEEWRDPDYDNEYEPPSMMPPGDLPADALNLGAACEPRLLLHFLLPSLLPLLLNAIRR
ncbi:lachesin isoform X2, partial [Vespula squamosa]